MPGSLRSGNEYRRQTSKRFQPVTVSREQPIPPGLSASRALGDRRLVPATWAIAIAIRPTTRPDLIQQRWRNLPPLLAGLPTLAVVLVMARRGRRAAAI